MKRLLLAVFILGMCVSVGTAALYDWNPTKRPAVSLEDALSKAKVLLGDDAANRYCVSVALFGNKESDGRQGAWNLYFAAVDGSMKHVYINMEGDAHMMYHAPIDWTKNEGRRSGLADVEQRLKTLFADEHIDAQITLHDGRLEVRHNSRVFQVHPRLANGEFGDNLEEVIGPKKDGIVIDIFETDRRDRNWDQFSFGPVVYGNVDRGQFLLAGKDRYLNVDLKYGDGLRVLPGSNEEHLVLQLYQVFGERAQWP